MRKLLLLIAFCLSLSAFAAGDSMVIYTQSDVSVTTSSTLFLTSRPNRRYLLIQNKGSTSIIVKFASVQSGSEGVVIVAGGSYEPSKAPTESVWMESASGTDTVALIEGI